VGEPSTPTLIGAVRAGDGVGCPADDECAVSFCKRWSRWAALARLD